MNKKSRENNISTETLILISGIKKGYTLVELIIIISIISLLSFIVINQHFNTLNDAKLATVQGHTVTLRNTITMYQIFNGDYPNFPLNEEDIKLSDVNNGSTSLSKIKPFSSIYGHPRITKIPSYKGNGHNIIASNRFVKPESMLQDDTLVGDESGGYIYLYFTPTQMERMSISPYYYEIMKNINGSIKPNLPSSVYGQKNIDWNKY